MFGLKATLTAAERRNQTYTNQTITELGTLLPGVRDYFF
jgi:hypothetical protein